MDENNRPIERTCKTCIKSNVCHAYEAMQECQKEINLNFGFVRFPFNAEIMALHCKEYLRDKKIEQTKGVSTDHCCN